MQWQVPLTVMGPSGNPQSVRTLYTPKSDAPHPPVRSPPHPQVCAQLVSLKVPAAPHFAAVPRAAPRCPTLPGTAQRCTAL